MPTKPKPKLTIMRPNGAATRPMPRVPMQSAKAAMTSAKEKRWSPCTPLHWRPNSNPSSPGLYEGPYQEERWRRAPMAAVQRRIEGCCSSSRGDTSGCSYKIQQLRVKMGRPLVVTSRCRWVSPALRYFLCCTCCYVRRRGSTAGGLQRWIEGGWRDHRWAQLKDYRG
ncbi:hypothetical protein GW17_00034821 [Ensete ventricosum]|nr:hypothetical protein GW17_00034821 [Ensete ventricosum]